MDQLRKPPVNDALRLHHIREPEVEAKRDFGQHRQAGEEVQITVILVPSFCHDYTLTITHIIFATFL